MQTGRPQPRRPNVVLIVADDLGYGDISAYNRSSGIDTPGIDEMAGRGISFSDAHATSSVCTPSRYSILTGEYNWRSGLKNGIVRLWDGPIIEEDQPTIGSILRDHGYDTACIGKWHLGWDWPTHDGSHPNDSLPLGLNDEEAAQRRIEFGLTNIDFTRPIASGPVQRGFDWYFGVDVPNYPPYTWIENDRIVEQPTVLKTDQFYGDEGWAAPGWSHQEMLPRFAQLACDYIAEHGAVQDERRPFFLYLPLTAPHSPVSPSEQFVGATPIGPYGDLVREVDWFVSRIRSALESAGIAEDTLLVFTSDNGPETEVGDDEGVYRRAERTGHHSSGELRGVKRDAWEGGHRVPLIAEWPGVIPEAQQSPALASLVDLLVTFADATGCPLPDSASRDGVSLLPVLTGDAGQARESLVIHSFTGKFGVRKGPWMLIDAANGAENLEPEWLRQARGYHRDNHPAELFNLAEDPAQRVNLFAQHPEIVASLHRQLHAVQSQPEDLPPRDQPPAGYAG